MSTQKFIRVAGAQVNSDRNIQASLKKALTFIEKAAVAQAEFLLFPEMYLTGYTHLFDERESEKALEEVQAAARTNRIHVLMGTGGRHLGQTTNQVRIFSPAGKLLGVHEKIHLQSEKAYVPGRSLRTYTAAGLSFAVLICNDFWATPRSTWGRVPLLVQEAQNQGATVVFHSISCGNEPDPVKREILKSWHVAAHRTWAMRIGITVVAANQPGPLGSLVNCGVIGSDGQYIAKVPNRGERLFVADVPLAGTKSPRALAAV